MLGNYFLINGKFLAVDSFEKKEADINVYEVMRVIDGIPLFLREHISRLLHSIQLSKRVFEIDKKELGKDIVQLCKKNEIEEGNIMVKVMFSSDNVTVLVHFIEHFYPSLSNYTKGVSVGLLKAKRINPKAKIINHTVRDLANNEIRTSKSYEVLLVDEQNEIREGSRSNFFGIKDGKLYTAPLNLVLKGITLSKVIAIAKSNKIEICYKPIPVSVLSNFDAAFLSGTSPKILPISAIDSTTFDVKNALLLKIMNAYDELVCSDIKRYISLLK
ncbi:MAG: aminotransferase class IV [Prolixibacteraceae bacterium]|jgi:branched-chain amino acid aminotransferase|nr:aminotransferase class IV [Prolixibacteraceae bacterium]